MGNRDALCLVPVVLCCAVLCFDLCFCLLGVFGLFSVRVV